MPAIRNGALDVVENSVAATLKQSTAGVLELLLVILQPRSNRKSSATGICRTEHARGSTALVSASPTHPD